MNKLILPLVLFGTTCISINAQNDPTPDSVAYRQFDFWVGQWDVYRGSSDTLVGDSRIELSIDGFAIQEFYRSVSTPSYQGTSLSKWNPTNKRWEQYWIDNSGATLHVYGSYQDGKMILGNSNNTPNGLLYNRISWELHDTGHVTQLWEQSQNGSEWVAVFNGRYERKE